MVARCVAELGRVDILVTVAGVVSKGSAEALEETEWDRVINVNMKGVFLSCQAVIPAMRAQKSGRIINIGSVNAYIGEPKLLAYAASKGALMTLTKNLENHGVLLHKELSYLHSSFLR